MDSRGELREFLTSRRAHITPTQAGLPVYGGGRRRVPGLRRDELANLAGVSVEYYTKLERGNAHGVSDSVLEALVRALRLDDAERAHLFDLARASSTTSRARRRPSQERVRLGIQQLLDAMTDVPAIVQNGRLDLLASNKLSRALFADMLEPPAQGSAGPPNFARYTFLDRRAVERYPEWSHVAGDTVALLRAEVGRAPEDRQLIELVGELATRSTEFSSLWASHDVRWHTTGTKKLHHPVVGDLVLAYEGLELAADPGQTLITFTADPKSPSQEALTFLGSWSASSARACDDSRTRVQPADGSA
jgi:transcriptional regulator with XRE-family HTH domain